MKRYLFLSLSIAILSLISCKTEQAQGIALVEGSIEGLVAEQIVVGKAINPSYNHILPQDTVEVFDGKFSFSIDSIEAGVYGLYIRSQEEANNTIVYAYLEAGKQNLSIKRSKHNFLQVRASGSSMVEAYQAWTDEFMHVSHRTVIDSLDNLFYSARRTGDSELMAQVKESSMRPYRQAETEKAEFIRTELAKDQRNALGIYLYYTYIFRKANYGSIEDIAQSREQIELFDSQAKATFYYKTMLKELADAEQSVVGAVAPDFSGVNAQGETLKLSDFRGKYVLVDFWSSGCSWCRKETPNIKKTYDEFKDKNFTVLASSLDVDHEAWQQAVEEDGLYWDSILMSSEDRNTMSQKYNVKGIPLILLLDPEGRILARNLRGEDIYLSVQKYLK